MTLLNMPGKADDIKKKKMKNASKSTS